MFGSLISGARLWLGLAAVALLVVSHGWAFRRGEAAVQVRWDAAVSAERALALEQAQTNARETLRRLEAQDANQRALDARLAVARADAERNRTDAERLREQAAAAAAAWRARLGDSPSAGDLEAAGAALAVCADLLGRADRRAGELAEFADASRAAGLKCAADYDALRIAPAPQPR